MQQSQTTAADLVQRFYDELWNQADERVAPDILHADLSFRGSLGPVLSGRDGFLGYLRQVHAALAEFRCIIDNLIAAGDRAAARMTFSGIHRGEFFGVPASGQRVTWSGAAFFAIADDRIKDIWVLGDIDGIKRQLGVSAATTFGQP